MNTEPIDVTSLDDLGEVVFAVEIPRPDGKVVRVRLRALTDAKIWGIRNSITWPTAPVRDYRKTEGDVLPVYDYANADFLKAQSNTDRNLTRRLMAAALEMDIPGDTLEEKAAEVEKKLGQWAAQYIIGVLNKLTDIDQAAIDNAVRSFRLPKGAGVSGNGSGAAESNSVVSLVESGTG
jgi:hypothetical protein